MSEPQICLLLIVIAYIVPLVMCLIYHHYGYDTEYPNIKQDLDSGCLVFAFFPLVNFPLMCGLISDEEVTLDRQKLMKDLTNVIYFLPVLAILTLWLL